MTPVHPRPSTAKPEPYSLDDAPTQKLKAIEAKWWPRELELMYQLADAGLLSGYIMATQQHRRRSHAGRSLPDPWAIAEPGSDWWIKFRQCEALAVERQIRLQMGITDKKS